jgi:sugar/nucleoside kinase (ribokinase family)
VQAATPVDTVIDTTGAGDACCAGFLYGWAHGKSLGKYARYHTFCAIKVSQRFSGRIEPGLLDDFEFL